MGMGSTTCRQFWTPYFGEEIGARGGYGEITGDLMHNAHQELPEGPWSVLESLNTSSRYLIQRHTM